MKLFQYVRKELIMTNLKAKDKADALRRMTLAFKDAGLIQNEKKLFRCIMAREKLMTTGIGKGLAVPHAFSGDVQDMAIAVALLSKELDFQSLDQRPVKVIFMIIVNDQKIDLNLKTLAGIARMTSHTPILKRLGLATGSSEVLSIIQESEGQVAHH